VVPPVKTPRLGAPSASQALILTSPLTVGVHWYQTEWEKDEPGRPLISSPLSPAWIVAKLSSPWTVSGSAGPTVVASARLSLAGGVVARMPSVKVPSPRSLPLKATR
jgi:hypothetical protein